MVFNFQLGAVARMLRVGPTAALLAVASACLVDEGSEDEGGTPASGVFTAAGAGDDTGSCEAGTAGCACAQGACLDQLVCIASICSWPPPDDDAESGSNPPVETGNDESSGVDSAGDSGPTACADSDACAAYEVCATNNVCAYALDLAYEIRVPTWAPATCIDNVVDADADLWWQLELDGSVAGSSEWVQGGCPGNWPATSICVPAGALYASFVLLAWDEDGASDELQDVLWWDADSDRFADIIDLDLLHAGAYDGVTNTGGSVRVEFAVVDGCD